MKGEAEVRARLEEMVIEYKCGHKKNSLSIINNDSISVSAYFEWSSSVGIFGDKSLCFDCWVLGGGGGEG